MRRKARPADGTNDEGTRPGLLDEALDLSASPFRRLLVWQTARTLLRLCLLGAMAVLIGNWIIVGTTDVAPVAATLVFLALSTIAGLMADRRQAEAEARLTSELRHRVGATLASMPARAVQSLSAGELVVAMQRHPEAIATLAIGHRAAKAMMALGPFCAAAFLFCVSWQAALTVVVLTPVMIVFFVLVGEAIRTRAEAREKAFGRLAGQFADRIRGLPTILANHALPAETAKLDQRLETHATQTMGVLRIAFLNAGVIDFFSSLSIAILAVFLGLGHLKLATIPGFHDLALWQSLFVLMVAPDYFAPFRRYAEQYHAKADGLAAASALDRLLNPTLPPFPGGQEFARLASGILLPPKGLVALVGPSGSGKSTLLRHFAGLERNPVASPSPATWVATDSHVPKGDLAGAILWNARRQNQAALIQAAGRVGLLDDALLPGGLETRLDIGGAALSGGQRLRIAVARALLTDGTVFADEPTAKLDATTAELVRAALRDMASSRLVIVATHDPILLGQAERRIALGPLGNPTREARTP